MPLEQKETPIPPLLTPYISYKFVYTRCQGDPSTQDGEMVLRATESGAFRLKSSHVEYVLSTYSYIHSLQYIMV